MPSLLYSLKLVCKKLKIRIIAEYKNTKITPFWGSSVPIQHNVVCADAYLLTKCLCPLFRGRGAGSPSNTNTMFLGSRPTSLPSGILIHKAIWPQHIWADNWGLCPFGEGQLGPHLTQCGNTMWPGQRPTSMPSFILIRPTVWSQYTNVTDRQTDRQDNDPIA